MAAYLTDHARGRWAERFPDGGDPVASLRRAEPMNPVVKAAADIWAGRRAGKVRLRDKCRCRFRYDPAACAVWVVDGPVAITVLRLPAPAVRGVPKWGR